MTADVTVVVPFFGERHTELARQRAIPSAKALGVEVISVATHPAQGVSASAALAGARQAGLDDVETEWVVHLDADDALTPGYLDALAAGTADIRVPAVEYHNTMTGGYQPPALWRKPRPREVERFHIGPPPPDCVCLCPGNWVPIGAMARTDLLRKVGGWHDHPWSEDWCLWLRCHLAGASFEQIPAAVYTAYTMHGGRNQAQRPTRNEAHREIAAENGIESAR